MIVLRSIAFNVLFYLNTLVYLLIALPTFFMPYTAILAVAKSWGRTNLVLLRVVAGVKCEIRGRDKIPAGAVIVASKHQSAWETFALQPLFDNPVFILKRELQWLPVFGWLTIKARSVPVDRRKGAQALSAMIERARIELALKRQLIHRMKMLAVTATIMKKIFCQPPALLRKPNAAPVLWTSTRFRKGAR